MRRRWQLLSPLVQRHLSPDFHLVRRPDGGGGEGDTNQSRDPSFFPVVAANDIQVSRLPHLTSR